MTDGSTRERCKKRGVRLAVTCDVKLPKDSLSSAPQTDESGSFFFSMFAPRAQQMATAMATGRRISRKQYICTPTLGPNGPRTISDDMHDDRQ